MSETNDIEPTLPAIIQANNNFAFDLYHSLKVTSSSTPSLGRVVDPTPKAD